jgi:predicted nucleic acid-binding protein
LTSSFDSNLLVYACDPSADDRYARSFDLVARGMSAGTSLLLLQCLAEFANIATRKLLMPMPQVFAMTEAWRAVLPVHPAASEDLGAALRAMGAHTLSFWDAMLWAAAERLGVQYLLSEDFQDGRQLGGVTFVNPLNRANDALIDRILPA